MPTVDLLLATFRNEDYLVALLDSLAAQTFRDFRLIVSDDCSDDRSCEIVESYRDRFSDFTLFRQSRPSGSAKANFSFLLGQSTADYTLFADADDIWDPDKVETFVNRLIEGDRRDGASVPRFVFSDTRIIDGEGKVTRPSYWGYKKVSPEPSDTPASTLVCPPMLGCAAGINRSLRDLGNPVPVEKVTGHDWWLFLVAKFLGAVETIAEPTMSYRIHGQNSSNQRRVNLGDYMRSDSKIERVRRGMRLRQLQAEALLDAFGPQLPDDRRKLLQDFASLDSRGAISKRLTLLSHGILYPDLPRNLAMLLAA